MEQEHRLRELRNKLMGLEVRHSRAQQEAVEFCRAILPVLRDHKLDNMAHELGAKLFAVDALTQEMKELVEADPELAIRALSTGLR